MFYRMATQRMQISRKYFGVTAAISLTEPKPEDLQHTTELEKVLKSYDVFEDPSELEHRKKILAKLDTLVKQWVRDVSIAKNIPEAVADTLGGKIYPIGSYRLGVHGKNADIDALCVAPRNIEWTDYFGPFFELLRRQPEVTECRAVEEAFVPVIKMKFAGIEIDLLFTRLAFKEIPDHFDLCDNMLLQNLDPKSVRSLNGIRVAEEILRLVPNVDNFRLALRAIKLWAKSRGIYSNSLGYFGGVSWAILVARTCQLYPNATAATLVHRFFLVFSNWQWTQPVQLKYPENVNLGFQVWDPRVNYRDGLHLMPIITPAYPEQNSTFNVSSSTRQVMIDEFHRGKKITDEIMISKAAGWDKLFAAPSFFFNYRHFIVLLASSDNAADHLEWCGLVESKVRLLVQSMERNPHIKLAHVNPKCFKHHGDTSKDGELCSLWFIGLAFDRTKNLNVDLTESIIKFTHTIHSQAGHLGKDGTNIEARHIRRNQLSLYLEPNLLAQEVSNLKASSPKNGETGETSRKRPRSDDGQTATVNKKARKDSETPQSAIASHYRVPSSG
ncbi:poly(A) polymerase type 3-like [Sabethes cyaneus]|uniref:poly(A) polymerase type 3-like n=1 Tax=Sabethes cyaneus TaxID=53552 RepID=UPI00237E99CE|nr:poly(A) polymerase type 3-like [Sabethes cyaneus]